MQEVKERLTSVEQTQHETNVRLTSVEQTQHETNKKLVVLEKTVRGIKMILTRVRKDVHFISGDFDTRIVNNHRRIENIEEHLGFPHKN